MATGGLMTSRDRKPIGARSASGSLATADDLASMHACPQHRDLAVATDGLSDACPCPLASAVQNVDNDGKYEQNNVHIANYTHHTGPDCAADYVVQSPNGTPSVPCPAGGVATEQAGMLAGKAPYEKVDPAGVVFENLVDTAAHQRRQPDGGGIATAEGHGNPRTLTQQRHPPHYRAQPPPTEHRPQSSLSNSGGIATAEGRADSQSPTVSCLIEVCAGSAMLSKVAKSKGIHAIPIDWLQNRHSKQTAITQLDLTDPTQQQQLIIM